MYAPALIIPRLEQAETRQSSSVGAAKKAITQGSYNNHAYNYYVYVDT